MLFLIMATFLFHTDCRSIDDNIVMEEEPIVNSIKYKQRGCKQCNTESDWTNSCVKDGDTHKIVPRCVILYLLCKHNGEETVTNDGCSTIKLTKSDIDEELLPVNNVEKKPPFVKELEEEKLTSVNSVRRSRNGYRQYQTNAGANTVRENQLHKDLVYREEDLPFSTFQKK